MQALKYGEIYTDALLSFEQASILDPMWTTAKETLEDLIKYLTSTQTLYQRKGQVKSKRLQQMTEVLLQYYTIYLMCIIIFIIVFNCTIIYISILKLI